MKHFLPLLLLISLAGLMIPNAFAENVPDWIKNNAEWWATDVISDDSSFLQMRIQYLDKSKDIMVKLACQLKHLNVIRFTRSTIIGSKIMQDGGLQMGR